MKYISIISFTEENFNRTNESFKMYFINKYKLSCKKLSWNYGLAHIMIYKEKAEYCLMLSDLRQENINFTEKQILEYTKEDLNNSEYLEVYTKFEATNPYEEFNAFEEYFKGCRIYTNQIKDLMMRKKDLGKKDILRTYDEEIVVSLRLKEVLENEKLEGLEFRPVYTKEEIEPIAYQIKICNRLPKLHPKTKLNIVVNIPDFNFTSYSINADDMLYYSYASLKDAKDFNVSYEYFGIGMYPRPLRIISQKVRQVFLKEKIKGLEFIPIFIEN